MTKAKWAPLTQGIDYISTQEATKKISEKDSLSITLKGYKEGEAQPVDASTGKEDLAMPDILSPILKEYLTNSTAGYVRINLIELLKSSSPTGQLYLRGDYSSTLSFVEDSAILLSIPGIVSASFISKEEAKKKYLDDDNNDWSKVLTENPLPNSIEIGLENKKWTKESLSELDSIITERIALAADFTYPGLLFEKSDTYYFLEYKRL